MKWYMADGHSFEELGLLQSILDERDPRSAREQMADKYVSGWHPLPGFQMDDVELRYPGDPPLFPIASSVLHGKEWLLFYPYAWLAIVQRDGSGYEVARVD